ncbi:unnamed protein product [Brassica oleracea var. botrytis]
MEVGLDSFQRQVAERFAFFSGNDCYNVLVICRFCDIFVLFLLSFAEGEDSDDVEKEISRQASKTKSVKEVQMDNISGLPNELLVRVLSLVPTFTVCTYGFYRQEPAIT